MSSYENEPIVVQREVKAVAIPAGVEVNLKLGSVGYITQALGGSFTVYIDGNLFRIAGADADAIGKTAAKPPEVPPGASEEDIKIVVWQQLKTCYDPEIPVNIVDLGLIYECDVTKNVDDTRTVDIKMTLTAPGCGMGEILVQDVRGKVEIVPTVARANVELVFDPPWNHGHDVRGGSFTDGNDAEYCDERDRTTAVARRLDALRHGEAQALGQLSGGLRTCAHSPRE